MGYNSFSEASCNKNLKANLVEFKVQSQIVKSTNTKPAAEFQNSNQISNNSTVPKITQDLNTSNSSLLKLYKQIKDSKVIQIYVLIVFVATFLLFLIILKSLSTIDKTCYNESERESHNGENRSKFIRSKPKRNGFKKEGKLN